MRRAEGVAQSIRCYASPCANRADMRARVDAVTANARAAAGDTADLGATAHAMFACAGTRANRTDMRARVGAAVVNARATAGNRADMGARAHAMCADMRADTHAKNINADPGILGPGASDAHGEHAENKGGGEFHRSSGACARVAGRQPPPATSGSR